MSMNSSILNCLRPKLTNLHTNWTLSIVYPRLLLILSIDSDLKHFIVCVMAILDIAHLPHWLVYIDITSAIFNFTPALVLIRLSFILTNDSYVRCLAALTD